MTIKPIEPFVDSIELREDIIRVCLYLSELGLVIGTWGNISVRVEDGLLITPSRIEYSLMRPEDLVVVDWSGARVKGFQIPSSEMHLHRMLLLKRPDMGSVVHTHSIYASAISCANKSIPVIVEDMAQIIGGEARCSPYVPGGEHIRLAEAAVETMGENSTAVLLANHGPVVCGRNLAEAVTACRVLEKAAQLFLNAGVLGGCTRIPDEMVCEERYRYLYKYGREEDGVTTPASNYE